MLGKRKRCWQSDSSMWICLADMVEFECQIITWNHFHFIGRSTLVLDCGSRWFKLNILFLNKNNFPCIFFIIFFILLYFKIFTQISITSNIELKWKPEWDLKLNDNKTESVISIRMCQLCVKKLDHSCCVILTIVLVETVEEINMNIEIVKNRWVK